ncbi:undecaprenyl-diphosphate phosphatase [bacterium]|nr:undecaprenyl-diphosphate phosphatase [bacterium]
MNFLRLILLGIIQGLTEFFPVSSSGHLVLFQNLFGLKEPQLFADVMLHLGTVLSLLVFLRKDLIQILAGLSRFCRNPLKNASDPQVKLVFYLFLASIPTGLMGYFFSDFFESLFASLKTVGLALLVTGTFLFLTKFSKEKKRNSWVHPFFIGILQGMAIVPGISRSGFTIGGALFLGWNRDQAARFSFLLSIPAILGASLFQFQKVDPSTQPWLFLAVGSAVAAVFGYGALVYLSKLVHQGNFYSFAYYCFLVGMVALMASFLL